MKTHLKRLLRITILLTLVATFLSTATPVWAAEPQEDPLTAKIVFSGTALFNYYADTLVFLLGKYPVTVAQRMDKMTFANIPDNLAEATGNFSNASTSIAAAVVKIDYDLEKLRLLQSQSRVVENLQLAKQVWANIIQAKSDLNQMEKATSVGGTSFNISSATPGSDIKLAYNRLLDLINQIGALLDLDQRLLISVLPAQILNTSDTAAFLKILGTLGITPSLDNLASADVSTIINSLGPSDLTELLNDLSTSDITDVIKSLGTTNIAVTILTLIIQPTTVYVGDRVNLSGRLTSGNQGLSNRKITFLLDRISVMTVNTDSQGYYSASLPIPYRYQPEMLIQALYYPQGVDIGSYTASLSPGEKINVLFYQTKITLRTEENAYPGRDFSIQGEISYNDSEIEPVNRDLEIYFDGILVKAITGFSDFIYAMAVPSDIDLGSHHISVVVSANQRYAPTFVDREINAVMAKPIFTGTLPKLVFIPGSFHLNGTFRSEIGTLYEPAVNVTLGHNRFELNGNDQGAITTVNRTKYDFSLFGFQTFEMVVTPREPWNGTLRIVKSVAVINTINCSGFLVLIILSIIFVPRKLRSTISNIVTRRPSREYTPAPTSVPVYNKIADSPTPPETPSWNEFISKFSPLVKTFFLYRLILKLIQNITHIILRPQMTLREYAREVSPPLGRASSIFLNFTRLIEKFIYSPRKVTDEDSSESERMVQQIEQALKK